MFNIIRDEIESIKVKAETKKCNIPSMEELRIKQEEIIDRLRGRKNNNKVKEEVKVEEEPVIRIKPKKVVRKDIKEVDNRKNKENDERLKNVVNKEEKPVNKPRKDIVEIDRRKNKENDDRLNNIIVKEEVKENKPEVKEEKVINNNVEQNVEETKNTEVEEKMDDIDYLVKYVQSLEDEDIMNATVEDLLSDPTLYDEYDDVEIIYDDYDFINEDFYENCNDPVEDCNEATDYEDNNVQYNNEENNKTIQWIESIMNSTNSVNDLFNQCKKTDDEDNE